MCPPLTARAGFSIKATGTEASEPHGTLRERQDLKSLAGDANSDGSGRAAPAKNPLPAPACPLVSARPNAACADVH